MIQGATGNMRGKVPVKAMKLLTSLLVTPIVILLLMVMSLGLTYADDDIPVGTTYLVYCSRCHGETGQGDGSDGATLSPKPRDFTDCAVMSKIPDATIIKAITDGGASVNLSRDMPAWGQELNSKKIGALAAFVRTFCHK
jgi:cytochrome c oxidase cbb3-type subunit III